MKEDRGPKCINNFVIELTPPSDSIISFVKTREEVSERVFWKPPNPSLHLESKVCLCNFIRCKKVHDYVVVCLEFEKMTNPLKRL